MTFAIDAFFSKQLDYVRLRARFGTDKKFDLFSVHYVIENNKRVFRNPQFHFDVLFIWYFYSVDTDEYKNSATRMWLTRSEMSEDCLYLNIWTRTGNLTALEDDMPMLESSALFGPKGGRPVMVWIHGGSLTRGSISPEVYNGAYLASMVSGLRTIHDSKETCIYVG